MNDFAVLFVFVSSPCIDALASEIASMDPSHSQYKSKCIELTLRSCPLFSGDFPPFSETTLGINEPRLKSQVKPLASNSSPALTETSLNQLKGQSRSPQSYVRDLFELETDENMELVDY